MSDPEANTEHSLTLEDVREAIADSLGRLFDAGSAEVVDAGEKPAPAPKKRRTVREDEDEMEGLIAAKVKELLGKEKLEQKPPDESAPATQSEQGEQAPEKPKRRRVESIMGWGWRSER